MGKKRFQNKILRADAENRKKKNGNKTFQQKSGCSAQHNGKCSCQNCFSKTENTSFPTAKDPRVLS